MYILKLREQDPRISDADIDQMLDNNFVEWFELYVRVFRSLHNFS